jgi:predicted RNA-binding Zn ribbon-like protein
METIARAGQDQPDGFLAIEFQHTEVGPTNADLPESPSSLNGYDDLIAWAQRFGVIDEGGARRLRQRARHDPHGATETYALALRIRETLDEVFRSIATGGQPSTAATSALADDEASALARAKLVRGVNGFAWSWSDDESLGRPLWPVVHDATRLLVDGPLDRVKACGGCRYLFIDESKNRSRRWCDMSTCGTAEKMRRYVERRAARRASVAKAAVKARLPD